MNLFNPQIFKQTAAAAINSTSTRYSDPLTKAAYYISESTEDSFYISSKALPPDGSLLLSSSQMPFILSGQAIREFYNSCNMLLCNRSVDITRSSQTGTDSFGRSQQTSVTIATGAPCRLTEVQTSTKYEPDGTQDITTYTFAFPVTQEIKRGDSLLCDSLQILTVRSVSMSETGPLRVVAL